MRWLWVDRFTEFVSGSHARGIKNIALDQEALDRYSPGFCMFPPTLIIEGLAQLGGILVAEHYDFEKRVVLAKIGKAVYHQPARPGDQLHYFAKIESTQAKGGIVTCTSHCDGKPQADVDLMFAFLEEGHLIDGPLFEPGDLGDMLHLMNFYHVAVDQDGNLVKQHDTA